MDDKPDWLKVHQGRLRDAQVRAKEYAERKAAERARQHEEKAYCPAVEVGLHVYLRQHPSGRNKIQDAWSSTVYIVLEVQGTTYTVEPVEGGPVKKVHRSNIRLCTNSVPVPMPRCRKPPIRDVMTSDSEPDMPSMEAECVLVEEVLCPRQKTTAASIPECAEQPVPEPRDCLNHQVEHPASRGDCSGPESHGIHDDTLEVTSVSVESETESVHLPAENPAMRPVPTPRKIRKGSVMQEDNCPTVRKT